MIIEGWMNHKGGRFTADMSDIEAHLADKTKKAVRCPGCRENLAFEKFSERRDSEGDISTWTLKHDCGADLTIFNEELDEKFEPRDFRGRRGEIETRQKNAKLDMHRRKEADREVKAMKGKMTFKEWLAEGKPHTSDMVEPHKYSVKLTHKGKDKRWPALKGEIYEKDVMIGRFSRGAVRDGYIPPIEYKFLSSQAKSRFDNFADSLSIEETIEALLPKDAS